MASKKLKCAGCGVEFWSDSGMQRYCSNDCRKICRNAQHREARRIKAGQRKHKMSFEELLSYANKNNLQTKLERFRP